MNVLSVCKTLPIILAVALLGGVLPAQAQLDALGGLGGLGGNAADTAEIVTLQAAILPASGEKGPQLAITARIEPGWHIYSITQSAGGPVPTQLKIDASPEFKLGTFSASPPPSRHPEPAFDNLVVEAHKGQVTWTAPIELTGQTPLDALVVTGRVVYQACTDKTCLAPNFPGEPITARLSRGASEEPEPAGAATPVEGVSGAAAEGEPLIVGPSNTAFSGSISPAVAAPGSTVRLSITAAPGDGWHIYALEESDGGRPFSKPTLIALTETADLAVVGRPTPSSPPIEKASEGGGQIERYHEQPVTWTLLLRVPDGAAAGQRQLSGAIGFQTCFNGGCDTPRTLKFSGVLSVDQTGGQQATPLAFAPGDSYRQVAELVSASRPAASVGTNAGGLSVARLMPILGAALLGGLILNLMPCVFPVIGLKLLSFVEQGGQSHARILSLNLWYAAGVFTVFMGLATLVAGMNLSWGEHFQSSAFNIAMAALVFTMALSFLGVWEIPIPGFAGSGKAADLAAREGAGGAFAKGVLSTVLATPCSGPLLGPVFGFLMAQPPLVTYLVFGFIALGMAGPYLLVGAVPRLIRFLPRPGPWMDTFRQVMGFVLLATVLVLFKFFIASELFVPTLALLFGLWAGCWWIGRTPLYSGAGALLRAWAQGAAFAAVVGWAAFSVMVPRNSEIAWEPFSQAALARHLSEGKTVMVDFTADWCLTCQVNYAVAIDTKRVARLVRDNGVVPLLADWTKENAEIKQSLNALGSNSIPLLAIFPAGRPDEPIILRDLLSESMVVAALEQAGPSQAVGSAISTAMSGGEAGRTARRD